MRRTPTLRRGGFTLVELLVAAALSLVVMTILAYAFQTGMATLSQLKSVVGMAEQLRAAENVMKRDLFAYHLEADQARPQRLSEMDGSHRKGYLAFIQGGIVEVTPGAYQGYGPKLEGGTATADSPPSYRTPGAPSAPGTPPRQGRAWMDHMSFTVRLAGDKPQETFTAPAVGAGGLLSKLKAIDPVALPIDTQSADPTSTQLTSQWAEVTYLLLPSGPNGGSITTVFSSDEGGVAQLPLYTLYRRQRVLADRSISSPTTGPNQFGAADANAARGLGMVLVGGTWVVLGPDGVLTAANRLGGPNDPLGPTIPTSLGPTDPARLDLQRRGYPIPVGTPEYGSDVLLNNVISMTIRPVYEFDVSQAVLAQLNALIAANRVSLNPNAANVLVPVPKSLQTPTYNTSNGPSDWLELADVPPGAPGTRVAVSPTSPFPRFYDTAGPSKKAIIFRRGSATGAPQNVTWDQGPTVNEISVKMKAIEIKLRVYDARNKTSRQLTLLQDL